MLVATSVVFVANSYRIWAFCAISQNDKCTRPQSSLEENSNDEDEAVILEVPLDFQISSEGQCNFL